MTKQEFLERVNELLPKGKKLSDINDKEYSVIETVYTFHPSISNTQGKEEIANLYVKFGWAIIMDMKPRAELMAQKEEEMRDIKAAMLALEQDMDVLRNGGWL